MLNFEKITTMEHLQLKHSRSYGAVVKYGDYVFVTDVNYKGIFEAAVYEFIDTEEDGFSVIECRLNLVSVSSESLTDGGHAIEWCIKEVQR